MSDSHPFRVNDRYEYKTSVQYRMSESTDFGMKPTDLVLVTPVGGYCVGPDGNVWWVPTSPFQSVPNQLPAVCEIPGMSDSPDESVSYLSWDLARNAREEDCAVFTREIPFEVEYAGMVAAYALSLLTEEWLVVGNEDRFAAVVAERLEEVRSFALWIMSTIDWYAVGEAYA